MEKGTRGIRAAFFDVDGTMLSFETHEEAASTRRAVRELAARGITPVLCTGRPPYLLSMIDLEPFAAFIEFTGQLCFTRDETIYSHPIDPADVAVAVEQTEGRLYPCIFMERERCYISYKTPVVTEHGGRVGIDFDLGDPRRALDHEIYQLNAFLPSSEDHLITDAMREVEITRWTEAFCDVVPRGGGKAPAIERVLAHLGLSAEECIAFGDGGNDMEMIELVGIGVAMGNAEDEVKRVADMVTDDVDHDGIWNACVRLGLVEP